MSANISNFWTLNPAQQRTIRKVVFPRCAECGKRRDTLGQCYYCDHEICPDCTHFEQWDGGLVRVCVSCHEFEYLS